MLDSIERSVGKLYADNAPLRNIMKKYMKYVDEVQKRTESSYKAYIDASDEETKSEAKKAYKAELRTYTVQSKEYQKLISELVSIIADLNAEALSIINGQMSEIYAINYNEVEEDCRKAGIKIGKAQI